MAGVGTRGSAAVRGTEGSRPGRGASGARRKAGRPPGSPNKPKGLIPTDLAQGILLAMKDQVPPEHFEYLRGVIKDGKTISTKAELDTLILLLGRNLWAALIDEMRPPEPPKNIDDALELVKDTGDIKPKQWFRRDVTERLKALTSLLTLRANIEKRDEDKPQDGSDPLITIAIRRGFDKGRLALLVGGLPGGDPRTVDGTGRGADEARTVSVEVLERPLGLPSGQ